MRPIGSIENISSLSGDTFTGSFDGNGYSITGMIVDWEGDQINGVGLYGLASGNAEFKNMTLEEVSIKGYQMVGALVGATGSDSVTIMNSYATGDVVADGSAGGLVGYTRDSSATTTPEIIDSYAEGDINGSSSSAGGLVGRNEIGRIQN